MNDRNLMTSNKSKLPQQELAACLVRSKNEILKDWENLARLKVPAAKIQSRLALQDSLPQFLDQLAATLSSETPSILTEKNAEIAREHGEDRAQQPEYTLEEVIGEYRLLRIIILRKLEAECLFDESTREIVHEFVDIGISKAAGRYAELESEHQATQKRELEATRLQAERASQAKSAFLANMSHEIRTPLGAIMGFVDLLKESGLDHNEVANYLDIINRNSHHLLRIVDDILDLTKVEAGKMVIEEIEFSLIQFMADFSSLAGMKARENGIVFEFTASTFLPEFIISDPTRLRQILSNVVGNAVKFTEKGRVELSASYEEGHLDFRVIDTGRGITKEQRTNLFKAFTQADPSTTRKFGGTGLGLILTKNLSQAMGGDFVLIESELGKGSTFAINIRVKTPENVKLVPLKAVRIAPTTDMSVNPNDIDLTGFEILVVEDSPDNQFLIQKMLRKTGAKITLANNGAEGVKFAQAHFYNVILMDIQMPVMDGHDAVRMLRLQGYPGPIIALTAHAMKEERERAIASGFSHFLTKPIDRKSLFELLGILRNPLILRL